MYHGYIIYKVDTFL